MSRLLVNRRQLLLRALQLGGSTVVSSGIGLSLASCNRSLEGSFEHGVASGDPLHDRVILWTRVTPAEPLEEIWVSWQVARDRAFRHLVVQDSAPCFRASDYTLKVDATGLEPGVHYFYRFMTLNHTSPVGRTKTLPEDTNSVSLAVVSCSNFPAGYFHVYRDIAGLEELDAVVHLGDYLYEYGADGYASEEAEAMGRQVAPAHELLTLTDYRTRYAQYRLDADVQAMHRALPMICVWDDHEIANDAWFAGADNHNLGEGDYVARLMAALQAYAEWMPLRPPVDANLSSLQRSFRFGALVNLSMLDTRLAGRDKPLSLMDFVTLPGGFNAAAYADAINDPNRSLLGADQREWVYEQLRTPALWQVLGQQVLMGEMELPVAIATQQLSVAEYAALVALAQRAATDPTSLTEQEQALLQSQIGFLQQGNLPYNLDAWDGYPAERRALLAEAQAAGANLVVLAGDTHNAWANQLSLDGATVGVELATASVTSPGLETYLRLADEPTAMATEAALAQLVSGLRYTNLTDRGYLKVTFTWEELVAEWVFVSNVKEREYARLEHRQKRLRAGPGELHLQEV